MRGAWPIALMCAVAALAAGGPQPPPYAADRPLPEPVLFAPGQISTGDDESHQTFSADGRRLFFLKNSPDFRHWTVVVSDLANGRWQTPEVAWFSGQYDDADVAFTSDESALYFVSTRPAVPGGPARPDTDLWRISRIAGGGWGEPARIAELSSDGNEWYPALTASGTIYFGSERRQGNRGPEGTSDLWRARPARDGFDAPENLGPAINTAGNDIEAWVAPDERFMILASNGFLDSRGAYDLYVSYQCDGVWTAPRNLGDRINSPGWDFAPRVSPDGRYLFFTSNRTSINRPPDRRLDYRGLLARIRGSGNGLRDIYQVDYSALGLRPPCD